jgi:hypothetical protein
VRIYECLRLYCDSKKRKVKFYWKTISGKLLENDMKIKFNRFSIAPNICFLGLNSWASL